MLVSYLLTIPFLAAFLSLFPKKNARFLEVIAAVAGVVELITVAIVGFTVMEEGRFDSSSYFVIDSLGIIVLSITAVIGCAAAFYSIGYLREEVTKGIIGFHRVREYFVLFHLFIGAMFVAISSSSPIIMWIALEATTISTLFLVSFYNKPSSTEAAWKYLLINSIGLLLGYFGMLLFYSSSSLIHAQGFITWSSLLDNASFLEPLIVKIGFIFVLIGFGTKMGLAPMHTWLPDAHSKAPSPISALLSGTLLNIAFLAIARFKSITDVAAGQDFSRQFLILFGMVSLGIAAFIMFTQKKYKRLFAYSSIEHMGIIALGFGLGGIGAFIALLHMIYHSLTKSILFFTAGNIFLKYGMTKIQNVQGVFSTLPVTSVLLVIALLAITGIPPFGIFITEFALLAVGFTTHPYIAAAILFLLVLVFAGFFRHVTAMLFGEAPPEIKRGEMNYFTTVPIVCLALLLVFLSLHLPPGVKEVLLTAVTPR